MQATEPTRARAQPHTRRWFSRRLSFLVFLAFCLAPVVVGIAASVHIIQDIRFRSAQDETRVVVELSHTIPYQIGRLSRPNRLYIDLPKTRLASDWDRHSVEIGDGRVRAIRIAQQHPDQVRIVLDLQDLGDFRIFTLPDPYRIIIDLLGGIAASGNDARARPPKVPLPSSRLQPPSKPTRPTVVIDPGHGGKDPGARGRGGLKEKTVVLQIAKELRQVIRQALPQYQVVLTRERDVFVPLSKRAQIANRYQAELFISLHANASRQRRANGIETWYLSFAASERAKQMAARENQMAEADLSDLEIILRDLHETDRINQSASLASTMQMTLVQHMAKRYWGIINRGIDGAPFVVLLHTSMPSVLVEVSFLSNPRDERRLRSRTYRRALAQGIFRGMRQFLQTAVVASE
jgi:N-acetylmuramoyl-L-alanine amidase